jgi:predicted small lipoprotein YifL
VNRNSNRSFSVLTIIGLIALSGAVAGCGRKAGLDLPPSASIAQPGQPVEQSAGAVAVAPSAAFDPTYGSEKALTAPRGPTKRIILDPLLD